MKWHCLGCGEELAVYGCAVTAGEDNVIQNRCRAPREKRRVVELEYVGSGIFRPWIMPKPESN